MSFFPPVTFMVEVVAGQAIAGFEAINAELERVQVNSIKAAGGLDTVSKSAMYSKMAFIGAGLAAAAFGKYAVTASMENEVAQNKLTQTLANMGDTSAKTYNQINNLANSMTNLGFSDNVVMDSMSTLITATGSVADATHLNAVAMDMARFKHISLGEAASTLAKGTQGNARAFKEFGITLDNSLPKQEAVNKALTQLQERVGGQAQAYTKSLAGQIEILHSKFELMAENIGNVLIPILKVFVDSIYTIGKVIAAVVGPVVRFIQDHITVFKILIATIAGGVVAYKAYTAAVWLGDAALKIYTLTMASTTTGTNFLNAAYTRLRMTMAFNPFMLWIVGLTALAAGFVVAWNHSETFRKIVIQGMKWILDAVGWAVKAFGGLIEIIMNIVTGPLQLFLGVLSHLPGVGNIAKGALELIHKGIEGVGNVADTVGNKISGFGKNLDSLQNKKIKLPNFFGGGSSGADNTSSTDPFNLDNYSGAGPKTKKVTDKLTPLLDSVQKTYDKMNKVISDATDARAQLVQDALDREAAAQKNYDDAVFNLYRSHNEDMFKLDRDYADKKANLNRTYQESMASAQKTFDDSFAKETIKHNDNVLKIQQDYEQKALDITATYVQKKKDIIQKSIDLLTSAFSSATGLDIGSMFAASFTKDNALANTLMNQVKGGIKTVVSWWGQEGKTGIDGLLADLTTKLNSAKSLADNAAKLAAQGYSQTFIQQIVAQGTDVGNKMADAILNASPEAQSQLKDLYSQIQTVSETGVTALATQMNSGAKLATSALTEEYAQAGLDMQKALADNSRALRAALGDEQKSFESAIADARKTLVDAQASAALTLKDGLADAEKTYNDAIFDMNTKLKDGLFDANKTLQEAIAASQKQFNKDVDTLQKDTIAKLKTLQDELAATAEKIKAIAGASAAVMALSNSPAAPYVAGTSQLFPTTTQTGMGEHSGNMGVVINQQITNTTPDASATLAATVSAIKFGGMGGGIGAARGQ